MGALVIAGTIGLASAQTFSTVGKPPVSDTATGTTSPKQIIPLTTANIATPPSKPISNMGGVAELSIKEVRQGGRREVNIKNAIVTDVTSSTIEKQVYCIKAPCPPITTTQTSVVIEIMGMPFTIDLIANTKTLNYARSPIKQETVKIGDRINVYGWQSKENPTHIEAEILRVTIGTKTPIAQEPPVICAQVITRARNTETGEVRDFPTPCSVPKGWIRVTDETYNDPKTSTTTKQYVCPQFTPRSPEFCLNGKIVNGGKDQFGCQMPPRCEYPGTTSSTMLIPTSTTNY